MLFVLGELEEDVLERARHRAQLDQCEAVLGGHLADHLGRRPARHQRAGSLVRLDADAPLAQRRGQPVVVGRPHARDRARPPRRAPAGAGRSRAARRARSPRRSSTLWATSASRWLDTSTARPRPACARSRSRIQRIPGGSRPLVGSSRISTSGSPSSAAAMARRWRIPIEYPFTRRSAASPVRSTWSSTSSTRAGGWPPASAGARQVVPTAPAGVKGRLGLLGAQRRPARSGALSCLVAEAVGAPVPAVRVPRPAASATSYLPDAVRPEEASHSALLCLGARDRSAARADPESAWSGPGSRWPACRLFSERRRVRLAVAAELRRGRPIRAVDAARLGERRVACALIVFTAQRSSAAPQAGLSAVRSRSRWSCCP